MNNYYETLGINKQASQDEIKAAYRRMASKHHPDKGGDTATFQKVEEAYRTLSDDQKRTEYDNPQPQFHHGGFHQSFNFGDIFGQHSPFADIFKQHQHHHQHHHNRKTSYRTRIQVTLEQAARGDEVPIHINTAQAPNNGLFRINIPQGIDTGQAVRYDNLIPNAELIVEFLVLPNLKFRRDGLDITSVHKINALELMVGTSIDVETIWGSSLQVSIPAGTTTTSKLRLHEKGLVYNGQQGHHYVLIETQIPVTISLQLKQAIEAELNRN
jgi:DnaJ-class molecular chaperone